MADKNSSLSSLGFGFRFLNYVSIHTNIFTAGSKCCFYKALSAILTIILLIANESSRNYCDIAYSQCCVNPEWILKDSKEHCLGSVPYLE